MKVVKFEVEKEFFFSCEQISLIRRKKNEKIDCKGLNND